MFDAMSKKNSTLLLMFAPRKHNQRSMALFLQLNISLPHHFGEVCVVCKVLTGWIFVLVSSYTWLEFTCQDVRFLRIDALELQKPNWKSLWSMLEIKTTQFSSHIDYIALFAFGFVTITGYRLWVKDNLSLLWYFCCLLQRSSTSSAYFLWS